MPLRIHSTYFNCQKAFPFEFKSNGIDLSPFEQITNNLISCFITIKCLKMERLDTSCDLDSCIETHFTFNFFEYGIYSCNNRIAWFLLLSICGTAIICSHVVSCVEKRLKEIKWPPNINIYLRADQIYVPFMSVLLFCSESCVRGDIFPIRHGRFHHFLVYFSRVMRWSKIVCLSHCCVHFVIPTIPMHLNSFHCLNSRNSTEIGTWKIHYFFNKKSLPQVNREKFCHTAHESYFTY